MRFFLQHAAERYNKGKEQGEEEDAEPGLEGAAAAAAAAAAGGLCRLT